MRETQMTTEECLEEIEKIGPLNLHKDPDYMLDLLTERTLDSLKKMMKEQNLTYTDLAEKLNTSKQYLYKLFHNKSKLSLRFLIKIAIALDCELVINLEKL